MNTTKHTATNVTRPGGVPVWEYRGIRVVSAAGTYRRTGWIFVTPTSPLGEMDRHVPTLRLAKIIIDNVADR